MDQTVGGIYLFIVIFLVVLAVLWFLLPFAIFGTKPKLDELIAETKKTNDELQRLRQQMADAGRSQPADCGSDGHPSA